MPVDVFAVFVEDGDTVVVLKLVLGEPDKLDFVANLLVDDPSELSVEVSSAAVVDTRSREDDEDDDDGGLPVAVAAGSVVAVVTVCSLVLLILVIAMAVFMKRSKGRRLPVPLDEGEKSVDNVGYINLVSKENN
jgi:hypothetical protein